MSYWVNGCVLPTPSDRMGDAPCDPRDLSCPVLLTWQTTALFRSARRRGGFWSTVAVLTCVAMWLQWAKVWGENLSPPAVVVPLGFLIAIFLIEFRQRPHPSYATSRPVEGPSPA